MNLSEILAVSARKFPNKEGFIAGEDRLTYKEVNEYVNRLANALMQRGIRKGDKVILFSPNTMEFIYGYFAVQRIGGVIVPVNAKSVTEELDYIISHSEAKAFIGHHILFPQVEPLIEKHLLLWITTSDGYSKVENMYSLIENSSNHDIECQLQADELSTMLYTSGTTGKPKGVLFTHHNILTIASMMCIEAQINDDARLLHMMPLSHSAPLHLFLVSGTYVGATHVLASTFTPELLLQLVDQEKITHFFGAPVAYLMTARHPEIDKYDLTSVRRWMYGASPLSKNEVLLIKERFKTNQLMCLYGLTEAGPNGTFLSPKEHETKAGSVGKRAALNCEVRIVNESGEDVKPNEIGEIIIRGEGNMVGYFKDKEKTEETIQDGWIYSGDLAKVDEDGYIWIVDRKKDVIISGGINIYPTEIENVLKTHPHIIDVAIVGIPHPEWGETAKAYVVATKPIENLAQECKSFLDGKVAKYKIPRLYEQLDELPRNAAGKILKHQLKERMKI